LTAIDGKEGGKEFRNIFGTGLEGAENALRNIPTSTTLTKEGIAAYKEIANRIIKIYKKTNNVNGIKTQKLRIKVLDKLSK